MSVEDQLARAQQQLADCAARIHNQRAEIVRLERERTHVGNAFMSVADLYDELRNALEGTGYVLTHERAVDAAKLAQGIIAGLALVPLDDSAPQQSTSHLERWVSEVANVANRVFDLDGCCHWETVCERLESQQAELLALRERAAELEALFDLQHQRTSDADALYVAAHPRPEYPHGYRPDLGTLVEWLLKFYAYVKDLERGERVWLTVGGVVVSYVEDGQEHRA